MSQPLRSSWLTAALAGLALLWPAGCGSKISEANYYKVQYGMSEADVDELLGPPQVETAEGPTTASATRPAERKIKTWTRGGLTMSVVFEDGKVVGRSADGIAGEGRPSAARSATTTGAG